MLKVYDKCLWQVIGRTNDKPNPDSSFFWKYNSVLILALFIDDMFEFTSELKDSDIVVVQIYSPMEDFCSDMPDDLRQELTEANVTAVLTRGLYHMQENYNGELFKRKQVPEYSKIDVPDSDMPFSIKKTGMRNCLKDFSNKANSPFDRVIYLHPNGTSKAIPSNDYEIAYTDFYFNLTHIIYFDNKNPKLIDNWNICRPGEGKYTSEVDWFSRDYNTEYWDLSPEHKIVNWNEFEGSSHSRPDRIYVCPSNTKYRHRERNFLGRGELRADLIKLLRDYPGYIGDPYMGTPMISNKSSNIGNADVLGMNGRGYIPPHNAYYDMSSISFYVETLTYMGQPDVEPVMCVTEKTWTPILKGHFILPFGPQGYCDYLKSEYDIKFPDFIDLSYDQMNNNLAMLKDPLVIRDARWKIYLAEVKRICETYSARELYELKEKNLDLLMHNRNLISKGPRHDITRLFDKPNNIV